jgi:hypothetical protein
LSVKKYCFFLSTRANFVIDHKQELNYYYYYYYYYNLVALPTFLYVTPEQLQREIYVEYKEMRNLTSFKMRTRIDNIKTEGVWKELKMLRVQNNPD